jgi:prepilin-type N-terminal cleavage/methylation domain-containing protein
MKEKGRLRLNQKGFTLIELMVALVLSFILVGAIYRTFTSQQKAYTIQDQIAETQQNARMAMNILLRDIRMAGYGMPDGGISISKTTYSNAIKIVKEGKYGGVQQPFDSITVVGAFGSPSGYLNRTLLPGSTELYLRSSSEASNFDTADRKYVFIGGLDRLTVAGISGNKLTLGSQTTVRYPTAILSSGVDGGSTDIPLVNTDGLVSGDVLGMGTETVTITAVSNNIITVDTDPETAGNQPITGTYPPGTIINPIPVFRVTAVQYGIDPYTGSFTREDKALRVVAELAGNIQDIQIEDENFQDVDIDDKEFYYVTLTAQTRIGDPDYQENQGHRRRILRSGVKLRNIKED